MTIDGLNLDEVGPPLLMGSGEKLSDIVRRVSAAGIALDQVVLVGESCDGCGAELSLDWAKNWPNGVQLDLDEKELAPEEVLRRREEAAEREAERIAEAERRAAEAEEIAADQTKGW